MVFNYFNSIIFDFISIFIKLEFIDFYLSYQLFYFLGITFPNYQIFYNGDNLWIYAV